MPHPKNALIDRAQKLGLARPDFATEKSGPEHEPRFETQVRLSGAVIGRGEGTSKRAAEAAAAQAALAHMDAEPSAPLKGGGGAPTVRSSKPARAAKPGKSTPPAASTAKTAPQPTPKQTTKAPARPKKPAPVEPTEAEAPEPQPAAGAAVAAAPPVASAAGAQGAGAKAQTRPKSKGRGGERSKQTAPVPDAQTEDASEEPFDGPWPMFDDLLAAALQVADRRVSGELKGEAALTAVRDFSLRLYKDLLINLGDIEEEDEED